jgi:hypothetical protein|tara:strand:- start:494 stop:721 length:228 start_codon:yes stop_codon:yes gene_type:complete
MEKNIQDILEKLIDNFVEKSNNANSNAGYDGNGVLETQIGYAKQEIYREIADTLHDCLVDVLDETMHVINKQKRR